MYGYLMLRWETNVVLRIYAVYIRRKCYVDVSFYDRLGKKAYIDVELM